MKKFYITTSIAYTNAEPHIGFALESVQADVLARYHRLSGDDVFFLTGTDEHGIKIAKTAKAAGKNPREFVDRLAKKFQKLKKILNLSNNDFIRTTDKKRHWPVVKEVWLKLKEKGDIYKGYYRGFYCSGCEAFIKQRDLINGKCPVHQREPEKISEENYFFKFSKYSEKIKKAIEKDKIKIIPESKKNEILSIMKQNPEDISFSRPAEKLNWGIPVPDDKSQIIYVWSDALTNYISALDYPKGEKYKKYWPADVHCIGKDILKFHALIWPAMLLSLEAKLPKSIFVHGFINVKGQKMSKSLGNIIDPFELVEKYGTDAVRYYLLREIPSTEDGDFTYEKFESRYNSDLANGIGNLTARVKKLAEISNLKFQNSKFKSISSPKFQKVFKKTRNNYKKSLEEFKFNDALKTIWELIGFCDIYIDKERPWENKKEEVINNLLIILKEITELLKPFLPETAEKILKQMKQIEKNRSGRFKNPKSEPLFPKILK